MTRKLMLTALIILYFPIVALSYDDKRTHPELMEVAAGKSNLDGYLKNSLGVREGLIKEYEAGIKIIDLLRNGSENEDLAFRAYNHFWDPIRNAGLDDYRAGRIWDSIPIYKHFTGLGNMDWAMGYEYEQPAIRLDNCVAADHSKNNDCNDYSWNKARVVFYEALTSATEDERNQKFIEFYEKLGRVLHLLQDMGVPAHTRNDMLGHLDFTRFDFSGDTLFDMVKTWGGNLYEFHVKEMIKNNENYIFDKSTDAKKAVFSRPEYYWDKKVYEGQDADPWDTLPTIDGDERSGLAEYSNANFLSRHAKFSEDLPQDDRYYFPYPRKSSVQIMPPESVVAEDGIVDFPRYLYKDKDGQLIPKFALAKYLFDPIYMEGGADLAWTLAIKLDEEVHEQYATYLIPKSVGYSSGLLDFFFRGVIEITAPETFLYAITDGSVDPQQFTQIKAKLKNITPKEVDPDSGDVLTYEEIEAGTLLAVARYKLRTDYQPDLSADPPTASSWGDEFSYAVSAPIEIASLSSTNPVEYDFNFSGDPIPAGVTDLYLHIVFKGTLGEETDNAVAVGMKDIYEPMHVCVWNSTDRFYLDGVLRTADEIRNNPALLAKVDRTGNGIASESGEPYIDPHNVDIELTFSLTTQFPGLYHAAFIDLPPGRHGRLIILTDMNTFYVDSLYESTDPYLFSDDIFVLTGLINQDNYAGDVHSFRGIKHHHAHGFKHHWPDNLGYDISAWPAAEISEPVPAWDINP